MNKKRMFCIVLLVSIIACSVSAYALTYNKSGKKRGKSYNVPVNGSNSQFHAVGTMSESYTTVLNMTTTSIYVKAGVQKYEHGKNIYTTKSDSGVCKPGLIVASGEIDRDCDNDIYDFYHGGETYYSTNNSSSMRADTYTYKAKQYYE